MTLLLCHRCNRPRSRPGNRLVNHFCYHRSSPLESPIDLHLPNRPYISPSKQPSSQQLRFLAEDLRSGQVAVLTSDSGGTQTTPCILAVQYDLPLLMVL